MRSLLKHLFLLHLGSVSRLLLFQAHFVLLLLSLEIFDQFSIHLYFLLHLRVDGTAAPTTSSPLQSLILLPQLTDELVLRAFIDLGLILDGLHLPSVTQC